MPTIALASSKGGCGKSTTALILASAFSGDGCSVRIVDADRSQRIVRWAGQGALPKEITVVGADEKNLRAVVDEARAAADVVIIDVEGSANMSVALAIGYSDVVIVPANQSAPDVEDAVSTIALIRDTEAMVRRKIPHALLWTRVSGAIRSREVIALEAQVEEGGIPIIGHVFERTAYKSLWSYATTLDLLPQADVPGIPKSQAEAAELARLTVGLIQAHIKAQGAIA